MPGSCCMRKGAHTANGYGVVGVNHQLEEGNNYERVYRVAFVEQVCFTPSVSDLKPAGQPYVPCPEDARDKQGDNAR